MRVDRTVTSPEESPVTQLLAAVARGDGPARERLWEVIYETLHQIAERQFAAEPPGGTLQPTVLVHEAFLRLAADEQIQWEDRRHFFAAAAQAMRRIRIDEARRRNRLKRGGGRKVESLEEGPAMFDQHPSEALALDEALERLELKDPRKAEIVMLRYFAGLTVDETAEALSLSAKTIKNEWRFARMWLRRELARGDTKPQIKRRTVDDD